MKNIFTLIILCFACLPQMRAQSSYDDGAGRLALTVWIPDNIDGLTPAARQNLRNKLSQIISANGIFANSPRSRFVFTANVIMLDKHIVPGPPTKHLYTLDITFYIGDGVEGASFASYNTTVTGVGENETKAYMNALQNIKANNREYQSFVASGKARMIEYFNRQCNFIIKGAQTMAGMQQYDEALSQLLSVPDVCAECWNKSQDAALPIFQRKIDTDCKALILEATNVWNAGQSWNAAEDAGSILSEINPHSACFDDALKLSGKIANRIREVDSREWNFKYDREITLKQAMIKAYRDVGVAYGSNQQPNHHIVYKSLW